MYYRLSGTLLILITFTLASCQPAMTLQQLHRDISETLATQKGTYAVAFKDPGTGATLLFNGDTTFHAASTMKTPVLIEVYKQAAAGIRSLSDSITVKNEFRSIVDGSPYSLNPEDDSEKQLYNLIGAKRTLYQLVYDMIIMSSNLATNIVIEYVDAKKVTQTMRSLGAQNIQVLRGVEDSKAYRQQLNNTTTANDLMIIFDKLAGGQAVDSAAAEAMIKILLDQKFNEIIPAKLPKTVKVAHKTGSITGVQHDSGIVFLPDGRKYILVILSKDLQNEKAAIENMATVSALVYRYMAGQKP